MMRGLIETQGSDAPFFDTTFTVYNWGTHIRSDSDSLQEMMRMSYMP